MQARRLGLDVQCRRSLDAPRCASANLERHESFTTGSLHGYLDNHNVYSSIARQITTRGAVITMKRVSANDTTKRG